MEEGRLLPAFLLQGSSPAPGWTVPCCVEDRPNFPRHRFSSWEPGILVSLSQGFFTIVPRRLAMCSQGAVKD
jgi:hypothetical protein